METNLTIEQMPSALMRMQGDVNRILALLEKPAPTPFPEKFGVSGFHDYFKSLGLPMSQSKQQKLTADGVIPCHKFNGRLVFVKDEIDQWIESQTSPNCKANGVSNATLTLAKSANRKMKGGKSA